MLTNNSMLFFLSFTMKGIGYVLLEYRILVSVIVFVWDFIKCNFSNFKFAFD